MGWIIGVGTAFSIFGLVGILYSAILVSRARADGLDDAELRNRLTKLLPLNIGSLLLAILGLMMVIVGVILA